MNSFHFLSMRNSHLRQCLYQANEISYVFDPEVGVFTWDDSCAIASSLKRSAADSSQQCKTKPFVSVMTMLNFYIDQSSQPLADRQRDVLEKTRYALPE